MDGWMEIGLMSVGVWSSRPNDNDADQNPNVASSEAQHINGWILRMMRAVVAKNGRLPAYETVTPPRPRQEFQELPIASTSLLRALE